MSPSLSALALCIAALAAVGEQIARDSAPPPSEWRYIVPAPGDEFEHAPFRALVLSRQKPDELVEKAALSRRAWASGAYAQIRFGSPSSTRVTIVVDTLANGRSRPLRRHRPHPSRSTTAIAWLPASRSASSAASGSGELPLAVAIVEQDCASERFREPSCCD